MHIVDLSLKINRHMIGIPKLHHYDENPTRCVVLSAVTEKQLEGIRARGLEVADEPDIGLSMLSRLEILGHSGTHIDAPCTSSKKARPSTKCPWKASSKRAESSRSPMPSPIR